jgi:hypothetical protein
MPKKITRLRIDEGSLVDEPANIGARVLLWKRHDDTPTEGDDMPKHDDLDTRVEELEDQIGALTKANADLTDALKKAQQPSLPLSAPPSAAEAELKKQLEDAQAKLQATEAALAKTKSPPPDPEAEDLTKGLPFEKRERIEAVLKKLEDQEQRLAKMQEEGEAREAEIKVSKSWPNLPVKSKDFGPRYRKITKALADDPDGMAMVEKILTSYGALADIATSGVGRSAQLASGDAWAEIEAKAVDVRKRQTDLTPDQAIAKVINDEPDLYRRYMGELGATQ